MEIKTFYNLINSVIKTKYHNEPSLQIVRKFLKYLEAIFLDEKIENSLKMTRMTILFEGFYRFLAINSDLKNDFLNIRLQRWSKHFGTPTVFFLVSYKKQIEKTVDQFKLQDKEPTAKIDLDLMPWQVNLTSKSKLDDENQVIVDSQSVEEVPMPECKEIAGQFLKTHNPSGGFTTAACDPYSQKFVEYAAEVTKNDGKILEIGAAFGVATLQALATGATVFCNDIDALNLAVVRNRYFTTIKETDEKSVNGDHKKLILVPGSFPEELSELPKEYFDAILMCRVLHFFPGEKIEQSLKHMANLLKPNGKIFIVCETPFLKNWQRFIPELEKRIASGAAWPGEITNPAEFESSGRAASLPSFVHWMTKEVLEKSLKLSNFEIEQASYINRKGQFPDDLILNGKESVGVIGVKSSSKI